MSEPVGRKVLAQVRLSKQVVRAVDYLSVDWDVYRSEAMERLLSEAIENYRVGNWPYLVPAKEADHDD